MFDILIKSLHLKMTYSVNTFIYAIKQIPLLKKILSDKLYSLDWLKAILTVLSVLKELVTTFLWKFVYAGIFIALPTAFNFFQGEDPAVPAWCTVLQVFIILTIIGGITNNDFFTGSMDKYYAVFLLRMDAKKHAIANYSYLLFRFFLGFLAVGLAGTLITDAPLWHGIIIPFFVVAVKLICSAISVKLFERSLAKGTEKAPRKFMAFGTEGSNYKATFVAGVLFALAYVPAALGFVMPVNASLIIMALGIVGGIASIFVLRNFKHYRKMYQKGIVEFMELQQMAKSNIASLETKKIDDTRVVKSDKNGFEFLNELFVKRHRKILWRSSRNTAIVLGIILLIVAVAMFLLPEGKEVVNGVITGQLRFVAFIMYLINKGQNYTKALFTNCDHSLLTFPIYRKGSNILKLFKLRLVEISKVNLVPAGVLAVGLAILLFISGGPEKPIYYLVVIVSVIALGIFFSVHYLTMYYLLQPFNVSTEVKSGLYPIVMALTYMACYMMTQIEVPAMGFGIVAAAFCIIYSIVACVLAYSLAPKTFKLRT
ncbi:MAG: hypothetical protein J5928_02665 [Firmicutes bacterium]|nr:hypothetical protein [Bacillota bacterium]